MPWLTQFPKYLQFYFNNKYQAFIGLSATIDRKTKYEENGQIFTKGDILDKIAPVVFKYSINEAQKDNVSRKLNIYVINHPIRRSWKNC